MQKSIAFLHKILNLNSFRKQDATRWWICEKEVLLSDVKLLKSLPLCHSKDPPEKIRTFIRKSFHHHQHHNHHHQHVITTIVTIIMITIHHNRQTPTSWSSWSWPGSATSILIVSAAGDESKTDLTPGTRGTATSANRMKKSFPGSSWPSWWQWWWLQG